MLQTINLRNDGISLSDLAPFPRWVTWRNEVRNNRQTKVPYCPLVGDERRAEADEPTTWGTREQAEWHAKLLRDARGIGFMLGRQEGEEWCFGGIDLDTCRNPETGEIEEWALSLLRRFRTYAEVSPSQTGVKLIFRYNHSVLDLLRQFMGDAQHGKMWKREGDDHPPGIELHLGNRYFAITDQQLDWLPGQIHYAQTDDLLHLIRVIGPQFAGKKAVSAPDQPALPTQTPPPPQGDLWDRIKSKARFNPRLTMLLGGDFSGMADHSRSAKALALAGALHRAGFGQEECLQAIRTWHHTADWAQEKGDALNGREMDRLWARVIADEGAEKPAAKEAPTADKTPLPLLYFNDMEPNLDAADFVEGVLIEGAMSVVYGESNAGKTFFVTDLALHVATGMEWRQREVDAGGVIYCALEGSHGIRNRVSAFKRLHGMGGVDVPFAVVPVAINLLDPEADRERLIATVRHAAAHMGCPVKLIVVDTLSRALAGGNENAPDDMGALVASADAIRQAVHAHICFIHHSGKDAAKGARGHSLLRAATDTEIEVSRPEGEEVGKAKVTKQRELEKGQEFGFRLKVVDLGQNRRGKAVTTCVIETTDELPAVRKPLPDGAQLALTALQETMTKCGRPSPGGADMPGHVRVVWLSEWRREFYSRHTGDQDAKQKAFVRNSREVIKRGLAMALNDQVWLLEDT